MAFHRNYNRSVAIDMSGHFYGGYVSSVMHQLDGVGTRRPSALRGDVSRKGMLGTVTLCRGGWFWRACGPPQELIGSA